ncbi:MAG TPA: primosomal protein N' [Bacteroidales bacterium]|nr:primosomal protein N' [Bacteroidales bacterium]
MVNHYADIILPLSVRGRFTYRIPKNLVNKINPGMRVRVPFGKKNLYSGIVSAIHDNEPDYTIIKEIAGILDEIPLISEEQMKLWKWISSYYLCNEGEVMKAALPSGKHLDEFRPKMESFIGLEREFSEKELNDFLDKLKRAPKQQELLLRWIEISGYPSENKPVIKSGLLASAHTTAANLESLVKKGIFKQLLIPVSRLEDDDSRENVKILNESQEKAFNSIREIFEAKDIALLHGVTSSGKTEIYIHLIEEQLKLGKQVLYMLPEIALTTQIIQRLKKHFGSSTGIYHSKLGDAERVEIWKKVAEKDTESGYRLILGVRSSVFLPFNNLGLVIIDEEHDSSYKQQDPVPRYHARDTAIMLANICKAKTLLGSASPSIESYNNAVNGKYGLVGLKERFGNIRLPEIIIANTREARRKKLMVSHFTPELLYSMDQALAREEQIILFQNRRGFSPYIECPECGWIPTCVQCAVNLTYHKGINRLVCHYCGFSSDMPHTCGNCNSTGLETRGFGTEKIEDEIKLVFPAARVARMDQDTTTGKNSFKKIIRAFEERRIDILIGTQMISKGLDFENLTIVGILNADNLMNYPDFRAHERAFQLIEQVSGRAGRRQKQGKVVIQTSDPANKIIRLVIRHDYERMFRIQAEERKSFNYPPFCRMIKISIKHHDRSLLNYYSDQLGNELKGLFGKRVLGPESPLIPRIQLWYIKTILIKIEREKAPAAAKQLIIEAIGKIEKEKGASGLRISIDVDPY